MEKQYTLKEASEILNIKVRTLYKLITDGKIKAKKYEGLSTWYISESEINRLMENMR